IYAQLFGACLSEVQVCIVESRHHKVSAELDHLGLRPFQLENLVIRANCLAAVAAERNRLGAFDLWGGRTSGSTGVNVAELKDDIRLGLGLLVLSLSLLRQRLLHP